MVGFLNQPGKEVARLKVLQDMEKWIEIRRRVLGGEISKRAACDEYDIHWDTLKKILTHESRRVIGSEAAAIEAGAVPADH